MPSEIKFITTRVLVILLGILTGYVLYNSFVKPKVLEPLCLVGTNGCVRIGYYQHENSALAHMRNTGIWIWFNGYKAYVYGQPVGQICNDPDKYEAAYAINTRSGLKEGYECVKSLSELLNYYKSKTDMKFLYKKVPNRNEFDVYGALNLLQDNHIIDLSTSDDD